MCYKGMFVGKYNNKDHVLCYMIQACNYVNNVIIVIIGNDHTGSPEPRL